MLKDRPFGWTVSVDELRKHINATADTYDEFKRFNGLVLKKAVSEINQIADIYVTATNIRKGRAVTAVKFDVSYKTKEDGLTQIPMPIEPSAISENVDLSPFDDGLDIYREALPKEITSEQIESLRDLAAPNILWDPNGAEPLECLIADYLREKVSLMKVQRPPVKNKFVWLRRAVRENWQ